MRTENGNLSLFVCLMISSIVSSACAARLTTWPKLYVAEFLTEEKSEIAPDGWAPREQVISDKRLFQRLRERSPQLLSVAILNAGFHPRWTMLFLDHDDHVRVIATLTYWGYVQTKRVGRLDPADYQQMLEGLVRDLECSRQMESNHMTRGFVHWDSGLPMFCEVDGFSEEGNRLSDVLDPILEDAEVRFTVWDEKD